MFVGIGFVVRFSWLWHISCFAAVLTSCCLGWFVVIIGLLCFRLVVVFGFLPWVLFWCIFFGLVRFVGGFVWLGFVLFCDFVFAGLIA